MSASADVLLRVRHEWGRRIEAEYRSAAHTQHFTLWLMQLGAPPDLLELGLRIAADELDHAELSAAVYEAAGGEAAPALQRETLQLPRSERPLELDLLEHGLRLYCLGETVAVRLFSAMRAGASQPEARAALDRILGDEVVHRDFGWAFLEWMLSGPSGGELRAHAQRCVAPMLERIHAGYGGSEVDGREATDTLPEGARPWGLIARDDYRAAVEETFVRDYGPRFAAQGIRVDLATRPPDFRTQAR